MSAHHDPSGSRSPHELDLFVSVSGEEMMLVCRCGQILLRSPIEEPMELRARKLHGAAANHLHLIAKPFLKYACLFLVALWSCVMSMSEAKAVQPPLPFQTLGEATQKTLHHLQAAQWALPRQIALLKLRHSEISIKVVERLLQGTARPTWGDYSQLMSERLAVKHFDGKRNPLILTPKGMYEADGLGRAWAKELGLHVLSYAEGNYTAITRCTCGESFSARKSVNGLASANSQGSRHLRAVDAGTWKPFDLNAFLARTTAIWDKPAAGSG